MLFKGTIKIELEDEWYVATCLENNLASQGKTIDESLNNLKEAISLYYEDDENREELKCFQSEQVFITRMEIIV